MGPPSAKPEKGWPMRPVCSRPSSMPCGCQKIEIRPQPVMTDDMENKKQKMNDRLEKIIRIALEIRDGSLNPNWTSDDIEAWDSVGHLNLILELEKEFGIKFEIEEMFDLEKLGDIEKILKKKNAF
jgi:acyl carrier protein